jgi:uncharacterized protein YycO
MTLKRDHLQGHDILLYRGTGFTSRLIQWGTGSPYNHVAVVLDPKNYLVIESNTGHQSGVAAVDARKLDLSRIDVFRIKDASYDTDKVNSFLVACLGQKYDYAGVLWLAILKTLSLLTGFTWQNYNRFQKDKDYFCSELCYEAFHQAGIDIVPEVSEADITSPGDIAKSSRLEKLNVRSEEHVSV